VTGSGGRRSGDIRWHRLDNTATVFPVISNRNLSSVYRVSARLKRDVVPELLQEALDRTMPWFESFRVRLRRGFFWYYFETNGKRPTIGEEAKTPCGTIDQAGSNQFLFTVSYFRKRISLEVFHALSDGAGAVNFLKDLTCRYVRLADPKDPAADGRELPSVEVTSDPEDSYEKNYRKGDGYGLGTTRAFRLKGGKLPLYAMGVIHGYLDTEGLLSLCRRNDATVTQYLSAVLVWSLYREYMKGRPHGEPILIHLPVNLRPYFDSTTTMNFFSSIQVGMKIERDDHTFDEMLEAVVGQCRRQLSKDLLSRRFAGNVAVSRNLFVRFLPLFAKDLGLKIAYLRSCRSHSLTLSNLGRIEVPGECREHIEQFEVLLYVTDREPSKCGVCSFGNRTVVTFTSRLKDAFLQRAFFRKLAADGLEVAIETNGAYNENL